MNKYKVMYGYVQPKSHTHSIRRKIFNTFDEAKNFINNLPKSTTHPYDGIVNLYAKIRAEGRDFWMYGNPDEVLMSNVGLTHLEFVKNSDYKIENGKFVLK